MKRNSILICAGAILSLIAIPALGQIVISSNFDDGLYPGEAGDGWEGGWSHSGDVPPEILETEPLDNGTPYLNINISGTSGGYRNVARQYESGNGADTIRWKFRLLEDPDDFSNNFVTFNDRVHFFARDALRLKGGTDASMSWGIFAVGDAHSSGVGAGQTFWIYDNVAGDSAFNWENNLDTGILLLPGNLYSFEVIVDSNLNEYTVTITDETVGDSFSSALPHVFRDLDATATSHTIVHFGVRASPDADLRAFDLDSVEVETAEQPPSMPIILKQPSSQTVIAGLDVRFSVEVDGSEPFTFQWRKDGEDIPDTDAPELDLFAVDASDEGSYSVRIENSVGFVESDLAILTVNQETEIQESIVSDFDDEIYPGSPGAGWVDAWDSSSGEGTVSVNLSESVDSGTPFLNVDLTGTSGGYRNVFREYESVSGMDVTLPHEISWKFRLNESMADFDSNFITFNDRVHFFSRDAPRPGGGTDASMSWAIFAVGAAHSSGVGAGQTFWIYDNINGDSAFNLDNSLDTGIPLIPGHVYSFTVTTNPRNQTYEVAIVDENSAESFSSEAAHTFRDLSATATSHRIIHFGLRASPDGDARHFDLDSIEIRPVIQPSIRSDFNDGVYPGEPGDGWLTPWSNTADQLVGIQFGDPIDGGTGYLNINSSEIPNIYRNALRQYETNEEVDIERPHTIRWKFRLSESAEDFENNFISFNDRVHFFSRDETRAGGGTDASMGWGIFAHGDAHSSGAAAGQTFHIYDNLIGDSAFNPDNMIDSGVLIVPENIYSVEVTVNPIDLTYSVFLLNLDTNDSFTSEAPHTYRDLSATMTSHTIVHFGTRSDPASDPRSLDIDSVEVFVAEGVEFGPTVVGLVPSNGSSSHDASQGIQFQVISSQEIPLENIAMLVNGEEVSGELILQGNSTDRTVNYDQLVSNQFYQVEISVSNSIGEQVIDLEFDTFVGGTSVTIEAEDYNYQGGLFQDDPPPSGFAGNGALINGNGVGYVDLVGIFEIDYFSPTVPTLDPSQSYRFEDLVSTRFTDDAIRTKYTEVGVSDYEVTEIQSGDWLNYTRTFESGNYNAFLRARSDLARVVRLDRITSDPSGMDQSTELLGAFPVPDTGGEYALIPLVDENDNPVKLAFDGVTTIRLTAPESENNLDLNYLSFLLVVDVLESVTLINPVLSANGFEFSFATMASRQYIVEFNETLENGNWTEIETINGDGSLLSFTDPDTPANQRFYRVRIE